MSGIAALHSRFAPPLLSPAPPMDSTPQIVAMALCLAVTVLGAGSMLARTARRRRDADRP